MSNNKTAEELAKEYAAKKFEYMEDDDTTNITAYRLKVQSEIDFKVGYNSRQSEIDTINNSAKIYVEVIDDQKREIDQLKQMYESTANDLHEVQKELFNAQKEVERLRKGYKNVFDKMIAWVDDKFNKDLFITQINDINQNNEDIKNNL